MTAPAPTVDGTPAPAAAPGAVVPLPVPPVAPAAPVGPVVPPTPAPATLGPDGKPLPDWATSPEKMLAYVADLRDEAAKSRQGKETAAQEAARVAKEEMTERFAVMLGLKPDPNASIDPAAVEAKYKADVASAQEEGRAARVELAVYKLAGAAGADPVALLDSAGFLRAVAKVDPSDQDALKAAITEAVTANGRLAATATVTPAVPPTPGASAGEFAGGPGSAPEIDVLIAEAEKKGDFATSIHLKRQRAAQQKG